MSPRPRNAARPAPRAHSIGSKATTPTPASRERARTNGGAVAHLRKQQPQTPADRWAAAVDGVLERFKADMAIRYADDELSRDETNNTVVSQTDQDGPNIAPRPTRKAGIAIP